MAIQGPLRRLLSCRFLLLPRLAPLRQLQFHRLLPGPLAVSLRPRFVSAPDSWRVDQTATCVLSPTLFGACMQPQTFSDPAEGFPGDSCLADADCYFGPQTCSNGVCEGVAKYGSCKITADCIYQHYCNDGVCVPVLDEGSLCAQHEACGRLALCLFKSTTSAVGSCTSLLSLNESSTVLLSQSGSLGTDFA